MPLPPSFMERFATKYPEYRFFVPHKDSNSIMVVDDRFLYKWLTRRFEVDEDSFYRTKVITIKEKPTLFWMLGLGGRLPVAHTILSAWFPKPANCSIHYKDGDRLNCRLSNLEWKLRENKSGNIVGITHDKVKNRWRVQRQGLKRSCHKSKEEAITALKAGLAQIGKVLEVEDEVDDEPTEIIIDEDYEEPEEPTPEEIALHEHLDKQFEENERRNKAELEKLKSIPK